MEPPAARPGPLPSASSSLHPRVGLRVSRLEGSGQGQQQPGPCLPHAPRVAAINSYPPAPRGSLPGATEDMPPGRRVPGLLTLTLPSDTTLTSGPTRGSPQELVLTPWVLPPGGKPVAA